MPGVGRGDLGEGGQAAMDRAKRKPVGTEGSHGIRENSWSLQLQEPRFTVHLWFAGAVQL